MTPDEKRNLIADFEKTAEAFEDVPGFSPEVLTFRPFAEAWTIHEHVVHCLEVDAAFFHRYRRAVAQPGTAVPGFDQSWTAALDYHTHDLAATLQLIRALRRYMAAHLRTLVQRDWTKLAYVHSQSGRADLENGIAGVIDHVRFHRELIDRNLGLWNRAGDCAPQRAV
ncbi:DinB family protein [bacterium]|nr:DinB family protein [bacterium]